MGYYSNLAAQHTPAQDHSYTPPEMQLLWRLTELEDRLDELTARKTGKRDDGACFSEENLRYVLPKHFLSVWDVQKAIELAVRDLAEQYGLYVRGKPTQELPEMDEITGMQISFLDIPAVHGCSAPVAA